MNKEIQELLDNLGELRSYDETSEIVEEIENIAGRLEQLEYTNY